jgi:hypothetical protein
MSSAVYLGVAFGAVWNAASVWCLIQLLRCWTGPRPSWRRALAWAAVKFPALYGTAYWLLHEGSVSVVGFGVGFTIMLIAACVWVIARSRAANPRHAYVR